MKYKYGIFDLDGTIFNAMPTYTETYSQILKERCKILPENSIRYYLDSAGTPLNEQFKHMLAVNGEPVDEIPEMVKEFFQIANRKDFALFDGAKKVLKDLHNKGVALFITTGSEDEVTRKRLERAGILKYFSLILGSSQKEKGVWHVEEFAKSAKLSVAEFSKQAFYCGDGSFDMRIAKMFGIYAIGVAQTISKEKLFGFGADIAIDKIGDIVKINGLK